MSACLRIPILADLVPRGDGTWVLRPVVPDGSLETWLSIREAAKVLSVSPRSLYPYLGVYLVYRKPLKAKVEVSLRSVRAFRQAANDPEFWDRGDLRTRLQRAVQEQMDKLAAGALQGV